MDPDFAEKFKRYEEWLQSEIIALDLPFDVKVVNPVEIGVERPEPGLPAAAYTWGEYMRMDLLEMLKCTDVALLPDWNTSAGAALEINMASRTGLKIHKSVEDFVVSLATDKTTGSETVGAESVTF